MTEQNGNGQTQFVIDADQARRAREEAREGKKSATIHIFGADYPVPQEIPYTVYKKLGNIVGKPMTDSESSLLMGEVVEAFLGDNWPEVEAKNPSAQDIVFMFGKVFESYRVSLGESEASAKSSSTTGTQPRRRSKASTASTS